MTRAFVVALGFALVFLAGMLVAKGMIALYAL